MKTYHLLLILCVITSCKPKSVPTTIVSKDKQSTRVLSSASYKTKSALKTTADDSLDKEIASEYATYYVVVADTGEAYNKLRDKMLDLHQSLNAPIDTMGRTYNKAKDLIALPDNDEDEVFAGDYLPRRTPSNSLSLEYLNLYKTGSKEKTIALVTGIFETQASADSALKAVSLASAFTVKASIYEGCLH